MTRSRPTLGGDAVTTRLRPTSGGDAVTARPRPTRGGRSGYPKISGRVIQVF
jgi:hypothetical protein